MDCLSDAVNKCYWYERWLSKLRESQDRQGQGFILLNILIFCSSWRSFSFFALIFLFFLFCTFFWGGAHYEAHGILVPNQGLNLCPLYWKNRILTTGPRVGSPNFVVVVVFVVSLARWILVPQLCPLQWKCRVLTTGLPGNSLH